VQEAYSAKSFYNGTKCAVISNNTFTKAAKQMAQKNNVTLLHVNELEKVG
jgi:HJR/Mrr/RecB family endonuclease